jgi:hypothetical protein
VAVVVAAAAAVVVVVVGTFGMAVMVAMVVAAGLGLLVRS